MNTPQRLDRRVVTLWRAGAALWAGMLVLVTLPIAIVAGGAAWAVPAAVLLLAGGLVWWLPAARYEAWRWQLTDQALELRYGLWRRELRSLPYFRIQHIDVQHGPLDRWLGLAQLQVHTASVTAVIPGLAAELAPRLRTTLLERTVASAAEAGDEAADAV